MRLWHIFYKVCVDAGSLRSTWRHLTLTQERKFLKGLLAGLFEVLISWSPWGQEKAGWCHLFVLGVAHVPPSGNLSQEAAGPGGTVFVPLEETSVESLLQTSAQVLATLQVPREQLSEVLEQIHSGSYGAIYRTTIHTGNPAKPKSVVLKTLKGKRRSVALLFLF